MKEIIQNSSEATGANSTVYGRQGRIAIIVVAVVLVLAAIFESLPYFAPFTYKTNQQISVQRLPDGSTVTLHNNSGLSLSDDWKNGEREAWVTGEAFFTIPHAADTNGITIHTSGFDIVALQAKLDVLNRRDTIRAWLQEGAAFIVTHGSKMKKIKLAPGDLAEYTNHQITTRPLKDTAISAWKNK